MARGSSSSGCLKISERRKPGFKDYVAMSIGGVSFMAQIAWCVLFYNWAGLDWLLYLGWAILAVGVIIMSMPRREFMRKGMAPEGERWLHTTVVVDSGIYAAVRHPIYLGWVLLSLSFMLISQHWAGPILAVAPIAMFVWGIQSEDRGNVEKFGEDYIRYQKTVPKANLILGIIRLLRRKMRG